MSVFGITSRKLQTPVGAILIFSLVGLLAAIGFGLGSSDAYSIQSGNTDGCWAAYGYGRLSLPGI